MRGVIAIVFACACGQQALAPDAPAPCPDDYTDVVGVPGLKYSPNQTAQT